MSDTARQHPAEQLDWQPQRGLRNRHIQSLLASLKLRKPWLERKAQQLKAQASEMLLDGGDGVRLHGLLSQHAKDQARPLVVLIHGWEGCVDSLYLLSAASALYQAGFDVFRLHLRDHGPTHHLNRALFHANRLQEVVNALADLQARTTPSRFFLAGFSLGGNFALRVAATDNTSLHLDAVIGVSPVLEPKHTLIALEEGLPLYRSYFLKKWRRSLGNKARHYPDLVDLRELQALPNNMTRMTEYFVARHTDYPSPDAYFNGYALTDDRLDQIRMPTWLVMADDDPVNPVADLDRVQGNALLRVVRTRYGGHCGFIADWRLNSWVDGFLVQRFAEVVANGLK